MRILKYRVEKILESFKKQTNRLQNRLTKLMEVNESTNLHPTNNGKSISKDQLKSRLDMDLIHQKML